MRGSNLQSSGKRSLFTRSEIFSPHIHLTGRFGSEGIPARIHARQRLLGGLHLEWTPDSAFKILPRHLEVLLGSVVSVRLAWLQDHAIVPDPKRLRREVICSTPSFILSELLCNAFDAQARTNERGLITFQVFRSLNGRIVMDVSDNGIGVKSVRQGPGFLEVHSNDITATWIPFVEGQLGVGLVWSKFVAEMHGGSLELLTNVYPNLKTTARVSFPSKVLMISVT